MPDGRSVSRSTFVVGSLGGALVAGCGGGNSSTDSPTSGRGAAQFTILWPEVKPDSRLIPAAAKSITIKLVLFFLLLLVDIVLSSFVEASFNLKVTSELAINTALIVRLDLCSLFNSS